MTRESKKQELISLIDELELDFIHLQFTDITGHFKDVTILPHQLKKALDGQVMFDGSSIDGFVRVEESDMYLIPDLDTFCLFPWSSTHKEGRLICDIANSDGSPFDGCPRQILKQTAAKAKRLGYTLNVGPEIEFFLFQVDHNGNPTLVTQDDAGYFDMAPVDLGHDARIDIIKALTKMNFKIEASHHEVAPGQHEIDFEYEDAVSIADKIMTFKMVVKLIAQRHGLHATFMPKPKFGISGSGMHLNLSLADEIGRNAFFDPDAPYAMSEIAMQFMAGLMAHAKAFTLLTNPIVNSYKRFSKGFEAPIHIAWSRSNRSPLIRIPAKRGVATRLELRNPDPSANPYLALAGTLAAGMDGIAQKLTPPSEISGNLFEFTQSELDDMDIDYLPRTLREAIKALSNSPLMRSVLGEHTYRMITRAAQIEWESYSQQISDWEIKRYLNR